MTPTFIVTPALFILLGQIFGNPISSTLPPRIITDLKIISGNKGVPIEDNSVNSSPSSPGCPQAIDGYPWLYFGDPIPRCYLASYRGPCPEGETLVIQPNSIQFNSLYGTCACDCLSILVYLEYQHDFKMNSTVSRYKTCLNPSSPVGPAGQVYDKIEQKCYSFYKQGPCPEGSVIVHRLNEEDEITCLPFCSDLPENTRELAEQRDECEGGMVAGVSKIWTENGCNPGEKYSKVLTKCVEDVSGKFNF